MHPACHVVRSRTPARYGRLQLERICMLGQNVEAFIILAATAMGAQGEDARAKKQVNPAMPLTVQERALSEQEMRDRRALRPTVKPAKTGE